jgi:ABC-type transporter Mla subunit MlaD
MNATQLAQALLQALQQLAADQATAVNLTGQLSQAMQTVSSLLNQAGPANQAVAADQQSVSNLWTQFVAAMTAAGFPLPASPASTAPSVTATPTAQAVPSSRLLSAAR